MLISLGGWSLSNICGERMKKIRVYYGLSCLKVGIIQCTKDSSLITLFIHEHKLELIFNVNC